MAEAQQSALWRRTGPDIRAPIPLLYRHYGAKEAIFAGDCHLVDTSPGMQTAGATVYGFQLPVGY